MSSGCEAILVGSDRSYLSRSRKPIKACSRPAQWAVYYNRYGSVKMCTYHKNKEDKTQPLLKVRALEN